MTDPAYLSTFPFTNPLSIVSERGTGGAPDRIWAGAGGGVIPLEPAEDSLGDPTDLGYQARGSQRAVGAYLRKLVGLGDFLFAAAGRSGFVLISKSTSERDDARSVEFAGEDAYSLSVIESSGDFLVYIATQYDDSGITRGRLRILRVGSTSTTIEATRNVAARVYAIAAAEGIQSSGVHTVLVGTSCDKLYRFDVSSTYTAFGTPTADSSITNVPLFHRDIVIHRAGTGGKYLYVALSTGGLGVLPDSEDFENATWSLYPTRLQPIGIALDPSDTTKRRVFVADGRAGTHLLDFTGVI